MNTIEFLRQFRIGGYAIFDFAASFIGMYLLAPLLTKLFLKLKIKISKDNWLFLTVPLSIAVHLMTGEMTTMTKDFLATNDHFILKVVVLLFLVRGLKNIKIVKYTVKKTSKDELWFAYILKCGDGTLYTGSTNNLKMRLEKHSSGKGAKYTRSHLPVVLVYQEEFPNRSFATKREAEIKNLSRKEKLLLIE